MRRSVLVLLGMSFVVASLAAGASAGSLARPSRRSVDPAGAGVEGLTILRIHAGFSAPTGSFSDNFNTGLGVGANIAYGVSRSVLLSAGVAYHNFNGDGFDGDATIVPVTFNVESILPSSSTVHPYIGGGFGFYNEERESNAIIVQPSESNTVSETNTGINFGAGIGARSGEKDVWAVGFRYHHIFEGDRFSDVDFITLQAAYGFFL